MNKEYIEKKYFVEKSLKDLLWHINNEIDRVKYEKVTPSNEEYVDIYYINNYRKRICVTADSLKAIVIDVLRNSI